MDTLLSSGAAVGGRLSEGRFSSGAEAAAEVCRLLRAALEVDLVYATRVVGDELEMVAVDDGLDRGLAAGARFPLAETICGRVLHGDGPSLVPDLAGSPYAEWAGREQLGVGSYAMTPLRPDGTAVTGTLCALSREPRQLTEDEVALLDLLGSLLARDQQLERTRAAEATRAMELEAANHRYRSLVDGLGDLIVEIDALGRIVYVNPAFTALTGLSTDNLGEADMMTHVHPDDRAAAAEHIAVALSGATDTTDASAAREIRFFACDGSLRWMSVRGRAQFDETGQFSGFLGILHDVTERVEAEQRVRAALADAEAARDEAERASHAKSEFLSRMSHELRTPLNAILGFGQLLELGELDGEDAENVEQILRAGRHLLDLINEVLDVVRIESGALGLSLEPVGLGEVVTESLDLVRPAAAGRRIVLRTPNRLDGSAVVADRQRLKQIMVNLLSNAVKYNREDGQVTVTWAPLPADDAPETAAENGWLRLSVLDTGIGIPTDRLDDVFTPFDRLGAETSGIEGTGVGLSLTRTLVEAQGGRITVSSEPGVGSTFSVDLPAAPRPEVAEALPAPEHVELTRTVLYVEDNPSNITLVRKVLARRPHVRLEVVQDGAEAVAAANRLVPDLVLLDLHLPGMPGADILAALRGSEDDRLRKAPIAVVTADLTAGTERRMLEAGATVFLPKPIDVRELLAVVDDHLPRP